MFGGYGEPMSAPQLPDAEQRLVTEFLELLGRAAGASALSWEACSLPRGSTHARVRFSAHFKRPVPLTALREAYREWPARGQGVMLEADTFDGQAQDIEADMIYRLN